MYDHPEYRKLQKKVDEHYRDLSLIWDDEYCKDNGFDSSNTLMIDSEHVKVQLCLKNCIVNDSYEARDVLKQPDNKGLVRDQLWQENYMKKLADFVIKTAENCVDVRTWLATNNEEFKPLQLLKCKSNEQFPSSVGQGGEEETKSSPSSQLFPKYSQAKVDQKYLIYSKCPVELISDMERSEVPIFVQELSKGAYSIKCG